MKFNRKVYKSYLLSFFMKTKEKVWDETMNLFVNGEKSYDVSALEENKNAILVFMGRTLSEVCKTIKSNAQKCYQKINLYTPPKSEVDFLCWCNRIDELMLLYSEIKGCGVIRANIECGIDYYKLEELKQKIQGK